MIDNNKDSETSQGGYTVGHDCSIQVVAETSTKKITAVGKKIKIPTTIYPDDPNKFYFRIMYREFFFGGFNTVEEVGEALKKLDEYDNGWDYDCFCIIKGANPLPEDLVLGFPFIDKETRERIENIRKNSYK